VAFKGTFVSLAAIAAATATPVFAQSSPAEDTPGGIQEILVTAQKRAENVQDVPIAISAFTAESLTERSVTSVASLSNISPNVTLDAGTPFSGSSAVLSAYIRGIGANDFAFNIDPGVGIYLDGVYLARSVGANQDLPDVERIEILKGPQGTLFGRNTIGGAISIVTHDPGKEFRFKGDVSRLAARSISRWPMGSVLRSAFRPRTVTATSSASLFRVPRISHPHRSPTTRRLAMIISVLAPKAVTIAGTCAAS
jgi:outer membrane receptor protein involved in Fe transport